MPVWDPQMAFEGQMSGGFAHENHFAFPFLQIDQLRR